MKQTDKTNTKMPELLAPAGDMLCLKAAVKYGADAVYLAGKMYGMRSAPSNFSNDELKQAVDYCHANGVKVYLTCNILVRNEEAQHLPEFLSYAEQIGIDAFIISDLGVFEAAKKYAPSVERHISTQAGIVNYLSANAFYNLGAKRIVTARELSLKEIAQIRQNIPADMDIECFVHGAMCMSFSGRCLISNYLVSRDANHGDCAQPCRWKYHVVEDTRPGIEFPIEQDNTGTYIFNSKDMCMIEHIPELVKAGITSFKIEGRAKSEYYVSVVTNAYRAAIDGYLNNPTDDYVPEKWILDEVYKVSYRDYCTGFYYNDPIQDANVSLRGGYNRQWDVMAIVEKTDDGRMYVSERNRFFDGDELEAMLVGEEPKKITVKSLCDENGDPTESANKPMRMFSFECSELLPEGTYLRKQRDETDRVII